MSDTLTFTGVSLKSFSRNSNHGSVTFAGNYPTNFADTAGCAALEEYMVTVGEAKSTLTVSYVKQAAMAFEDDKSDDERRKATSAEED